MATRAPGGSDIEGAGADRKIAGRRTLPVTIDLLVRAEGCADGWRIAAAGPTKVRREDEVTAITLQRATNAPRRLGLIRICGRGHLVGTRADQEQRPHPRSTWIASAGRGAGRWNR